MKRKVSLWQLMGFAVTSLAGTILHFLYDWSGENIIAVLFSGVNESTWEHMKLLFIPMFVFSIVQSFFFKEFECYWKTKLRGILLGLMLIPVIFYTYNGVIGRSPDWFNIAIFFISAAASYIYEARQFNKGDTKCKHEYLPFAILCLLLVAFVMFTFFTPQIAVFKDPISGSYGI